ncbi:GntR family transcriptional regulator [Streptacidiphilus neutrinimicus]|uniref:GntR family transcriptional regulator n=1 Tax=Streptacidiphilus neutrinimicus TaxID=105420 RepID=UPI000694F099|nr:GntR family transcriptional regulator [Streptacidiphilus neutrinimicus]
MNAESDAETATERVVATLRNRIRAMRPGERLPSRGAMAREYDVAPSTVQKALRELLGEGLITGGRGAPPVVVGAGGESQPAQAIDVLDDILDRVLTESRVTVDYFGFTAETLALSLAPKLDRLRALAGASPPREIRLRLLLPDPTAKLAVPYVVGDPDDPAPRLRQAEITRHQVRSLQSTLETLGIDEPEGVFTVDIKVVPLTPVMKLYIVNGRLALQGLYEFLDRDVPLRDGELTKIQDVFGLEAPLFEIPVVTARAWFESVWSGRARPYTLSR